MLDTAFDPGFLDEILPALPSTQKGEDFENQHRVNDEEPPVVLDQQGMRIWSGEITLETEDGEVDRSRSLLNIARTLYDAGATRKTIIEALKERDVSLGWEKYTDRKDDTPYHRIIDELEKNGRNNLSLDSQNPEHLPRRHSFKNPVPLHVLIEEGVEEPEELVDGVLLEGKVHHLYSEAGSGKSWVALGLAAKVIEQGETVVYVDEENGRRMMAERVKSLGIPLDKIRDHF